MLGVAHKLSYQLHTVCITSACHKCHLSWVFPLEGNAWRLEPSLTGAINQNMMRSAKLKIQATYSTYEKLNDHCSKKWKEMMLLSFYFLKQK